MKGVTKKFDGEIYDLFSHHTTKKKAQDYAKELRKKGFKARVIKEEYTLGLPWSVFKGRKKRRVRK